MRPKRWTYTVAAADADGYANDATGATWTLTATTAGDGLAHPVTITGVDAVDHSGKTAIITGTGPEGQAQTETIAALPNGTATVTSLKYFKTVTSVVPSATINTNKMDIGWTATGVTPLIPLSFGVHGTAELQTTLGGTTMNYTPQQTIWPLDADTLALTSTIASNKVFTTLAAAGTADLVTAPSEGATAVRILVNSHTSGVLNVAVAQPRD